MKIFSIIILLSFASLPLAGCQDNTNCEACDVGIEVFGKPGMTPEVFAPGFISTDDDVEFAGTFTPDYNHYFFTKRTGTGNNRLFYTSFVDGAWTEPTLSPVSEDVPESEPFITPDGLTLYFQSRRDNPNQYALYQSDLLNGIWQTPVYSTNGLNDGFVMYVSVADSGNIYFTGLSSIQVIRYVDGEYQQSISTGVFGAHPYIAPDESYMIFDKEYGPSDYLYITLNNNGIWSTPIMLGTEVNHENVTQICPSVTPDGKYFFFSRFIDGKSDIYWMDGNYLNQYLN